MNKLIEDKSDDMSKKDQNLTNYYSRRDFVNLLGFLGLGFSTNGYFKSGNLSLFNDMNPGQLQLPQLKFLKNKADDGIIGPYGEVPLLINEQKKAFPVIIKANEDLAEINVLEDQPFIRIGKAKDKNVIYFYTNEIKIGNKKFKIDKNGVQKLVQDVKKDNNKLKGLLLLRASILIIYPIALKEYNINIDKVDKNLNQLMSLMSNDAFNIFDCKEETIIETVVDVVTERVRRARSIIDAFGECISRNMQSDICRNLPAKRTYFGLTIYPKKACAVALCTDDVVRDFIYYFVDVVRDITREVPKTIVNCKARIPEGIWPNPFSDLKGRFTDLTGMMSQGQRTLSRTDISGALNGLKEVLQRFQRLSPSIFCLLDGDWELEQVDLRQILNINGKTVIPYGVRVCISKSCSDKFSTLEGTSDLIALLGLLAVLSPEFLAGLPPAIAAVVTLSGPALAAASSFVAAASPAILTAAIIIVCLLIYALYYYVALAAQLRLADWQGELDDNEICIKHPSIAVASVYLLTGGTFFPALLIPPIVEYNS